jgi:hypothetical protein
LWLRSQGKPLPTHRHLSPSYQHIPYATRTCPFCSNHVGDEIHVLTYCPEGTPTLLPHIHRFRYLAWYHELDLSDISLHRQISLLLASDPFPLLRGATRVAWIRDITPVSTAISVSLNHISCPTFASNVQTRSRVTLHVCPPPPDHILPLFVLLFSLPCISLQLCLVVGSQIRVDTCPG